MASSEWYFATDGVRRGPVSWETLLDEARRGTIGPADPVWTSGMREWAEARSVSGLFATGASAVRPAATREPPPLTFDLPIGGSALDYGIPASGVAPVPGGRLRRLGAYVIDTVIVSLIGGILVGLTGVASWGLRDASVAGAAMATTLVGWVPAFLYYAYFESDAGATPGKRICNLRVIGPDGAAPSFGRAAGRWLGRVLFPLTLGIGVLMILFRDDRKGIHDLVAG
ncbi:MAG: RDD family protein, partial [Gemmatimonadaceae bacterium]|nr:RDD family protein [Gemmatimonadaceae bacterium]